MTREEVAVDRERRLHEHKSLGRAVDVEHQEPTCAILEVGKSEVPSVGHVDGGMGPTTSAIIWFGFAIVASLTAVWL